MRAPRSTSIEECISSSTPAEEGHRRPPREPGVDILQGLAVHVVDKSLGPREPPHEALQALANTCGGRHVDLRHCEVALVGEAWTPRRAPAGLRALHRSGNVLRVRWLFDCVEDASPDVDRAPYRPQ